MQPLVISKIFILYDLKIIWENNGDLFCFQEFKRQSKREGSRPKLFLFERVQNPVKSIQCVDHPSSFICHVYYKKCGCLWSINACPYNVWFLKATKGKSNSKAQSHHRALWKSRPMNTFNSNWPVPHVLLRNWDFARVQLFFSLTRILLTNPKCII